MKEVRIHPKGAERLAAGHVWVYRSDVLNTGEASPGEVVRVLDGRNVRLGVAHYSSASQIALRMLPFETRLTDQGFFRRLIRRAGEYRERVAAGTEAYRLVHGEGDLLPGLMIDRYGGYFTVQTLSQGMDASKAAIVAALQELYQPAGIAERNDSGSREKEGLERTAGPLAGEVPGSVLVAIGGVEFEADLLGGQKTGIYLDQRENWQAAATYARGTALDCFSYQGGFALHLAGKCERVEAIDSSAAAVERIATNAARNGFKNIAARESDAFSLLTQYAMSHKTFDMVVLDPPAFAKSRKHLESAARAYKEINLKALQLLERDGILVTCSCSHHFSEADLLGAVAAAALDAGKRLRVIERRSQARDHSILLTVPETHYLKCLILQVV